MGIIKRWLTRDRSSNGWRRMDSAPRGGAPFLVLNHDGEVWVSKFVDGDRLCYRTNKLVQPRRFAVHDIDGKRLLEEDEAYARDAEEWRNDWTFWTRLYEFKPTHWMPLPSPPVPA